VSAELTARVAALFIVIVLLVSRALVLFFLAALTDPLFVFVVVSTA
jgi:hypothetical protein